MQCPEQLSLEQFYESALRRWVQFSMPALDGGTYLVDRARRRTVAERHAAKSRLRAHMLTTLLVSIGLVALVVLSIAVGVHAFLAAVGHYAPWEQIWAG